MKRHLVKKIGLFAVVLALAAATGCSSVAVANKFNGMMPAPNNEVKPVAHLNSRISGLYLFGFIPLFSGAIGQSGTTRIFSDTSTIENAFFQMNLKARDLDSYSVIDVRSTIRSSMILPIFLYWKTAEVSGTAVRPAPGSNVYNAFDGY